MIFTRRSVGIVLTLLATAYLAACGSSEIGQARPETGLNSTEPQSQPMGKAGPSAPSVTDPLDISALRTKPCKALSDAQREKLNLKPGSKEGDGSGLPYCEYEYDNDSGNQVLVEVSKKLHGLDDVYSKREALGQFEPTKITGYPAVYAGPLDSSDKGVCQLYVGVSNTDVLRFFVQLYSGTSDYSRPCDVAALTAKTVIENLKG